MAAPLKIQFGPDVPVAIATMLTAVHPPFPHDAFPRDAFVRDALRGYDALVETINGLTQPNGPPRIPGRFNRHG